MLDEALTHRSAAGKHNERLEFLGDALLNYIMAEWLYHHFPDADEGRLTRLRAILVKGETLAKLACELNLGPYLRLGAGEVKTGGQSRTSILADSMEALIAAVFLDAGMERCKQLLYTWFASRLASLSELENLKDAKTRLQEYLQAEKKRFARIHGY